MSQHSSTVLRHPLDPRLVIAVQKDGDGYLVRFSCQHTVWFAVEVCEGQKYHCSFCLDDLVSEIRKAQSGGRK